EGVASEAHVGRISGTITRWERDLATGQAKGYGAMPAVRVQLSGPSGAREARTDWKGTYNIDGLSAGEYELSFIPMDPLKAAPPLARVELRDNRACYVEDATVQFDGRISGVALTADGKPVADVPIALMAAAKADDIRGDQLLVRSDADGRYEFTLV